MSKRKKKKTLEVWFLRYPRSFCYSNRAKALISSDFLRLHKTQILFSFSVPQRNNDENMKSERMWDLPHLRIMWFVPWQLPILGSAWWQSLNRKGSYGRNSAEPFWRPKPQQSRRGKGKSNHDQAKYQRIAELKFLCLQKLKQACQLPASGSTH